MPPTNAQAKQQHFHPLKHHPVNTNNPNPAAADVAKMEPMEIYHNLRFLSGDNTRFTHPSQPACPKQQRSMATISRRSFIAIMTSHMWLIRSAPWGDSFVLQAAGTWGLCRS